MKTYGRELFFESDLISLMNALVYVLRCYDPAVQKVRPQLFSGYVCKQLIATDVRQVSTRRPKFSILNLYVYYYFIIYINNMAIITK